MTWFSKMAAVCATLILMGFILEAFGYTLTMCKNDCKDEPDDPVCSRWNFTMEDQHRTKSADYVWLRNECERKCFSNGDYERVADMELCYQKGQNRTTYICSKQKNSRAKKQCMSNASWHGN